MGRRSFKVDKHFYLWIFLAILLVVVVSILALSSLFYTRAEEILTAQVDSYIHTNMDQIARNIESVLEGVRKMSVQIYFDKAVAPLFYNPGPTFDDFVDATDQLQNYRFISPDISSIYIINRSTGKVYFSADNATARVQNMDGFYDQGVFQTILDQRAERTFLPIPRTIPTENDNAPSYKGYTLLFFDAVNPVVSQSIVVTNIDESKMLYNIRSLNTTFNAATYIIDAKGLLVVDLPDLPMGTDMSTEAFVKRIVDGSKLAGSFEANVHDQASYIAYTVPDRNGWRIISVIPSGQIVSDVRKLARPIFLVAFLILLFSALFALFLSRQVFSPIQKTLKSLEREKRDSRFTMKQEMLRNIITGFHKLDYKLPMEKLQNLGISIDPTSPLRTTLFRIDGYRGFVSRYGFDERGSIKFAIMNLISELMPADRGLETVDMGDDRIVLLEFFPETTEPENGTDFADLLSKIQQTTQQHLRLSLSAFFSPVGQSFDHVTYLYNLVSQNSFYRVFKGSGCIIPPDYAEGLKNSESTPDEAALFQQLSHALMVGGYEEAIRIYDRIIENLARYTSVQANVMFSHLAYTATTAIETIRKNNFASIPISFDLSISLTDCESIDEANARFYTAFRNIAQLMANRRSAQHDDLLNRIHGLVEAQFMNSQLSLESLADQLAMSPQYLSRLVRKMSDESIPDLIVRTRMEKARDLLDRTELPVAQVSERVGFTNPGYFYKVFKEFYGATPGDYRKKSR